jgi:hypothetical protein
MTSTITLIVSKESKPRLSEAPQIRPTTTSRPTKAPALAYVYAKRRGKRWYPRFLPRA